MRRWLAPWLMLGQAIAAPAPLDPKLELRMAQVHPADVVHLVADMRAGDFILVRPANEQRSGMAQTLACHRTWGSLHSRQPRRTDTTVA